MVYALSFIVGLLVGIIFGVFVFKHPKKVGTYFYVNQDGMSSGWLELNSYDDLKNNHNIILETKDVTNGYIRKINRSYNGS